MEISLALGGGGAKGNAHIGVFRVLEREGFKVAAISGTSIGGLMGAVYASGNTPDAMETRLSHLDQDKLFVREAGEGPAILGLGRVAELLTELIGDLTFADLPYPVALTSVDLNSGEEYVLQEGRVIDAVMATVAVPGIFPPKESQGGLLVDGNLSNPVPVELARSLAPKIPVIAVVLSQQRQSAPHVGPPRFLRPSTVLRKISRLRVAQAFNIFTRSVDISSRLLTELRLEIDKPEVIIRPSVDHIEFLGRVNVSEVVKLGADATELQLNDIYAAVNWRSKLARSFRAFQRKKV